MTLDEFRTKATQEVQEFFTKWEKDAVSQPDMFPMEMDEADWFEQLIVTLSSELY